MSPDPSGNWLASLSRATRTLLLTAVAVFVAWQLLKPVVPALVVIAVLAFIYQLALGRFRGGRW